MFTRIVEATTKSGRAKELSNVINDKVLPILKKQVGFVDETVMASDTDPIVFGTELLEHERRCRTV